MELGRERAGRGRKAGVEGTTGPALALGVVGQPIMGVLFGRGAFDATSALLSSQALAAYAFGLPAFVVLGVVPMVVGVFSSMRLFQ